VVPLFDEDAIADDGGFPFSSDAEDALYTALQELPTQYRSVLHLFYFEDLSIASIASLLGIQSGTVKVQLSRGRAQLRAALESFNRKGA